MGVDTEIAWTHSTFNPWWGCARVSPGCEHCYAEAWDRRWAGEHWGAKAERRFFGDAHWNEPRKWNRDAERYGFRRRVFCASMADVFEDRRDLDPQRLRLWNLIAETPHLDWQLLTKRPENLRKLLPPDWLGSPLQNVWLGTTVEDQRRANERIPHLLAAPAAVRFLSCEPLLGAVMLGESALRGAFLRCEGETDDPATDECNGCPGYATPGGDYCGAVRGTHVDWVIIGGESGAGARVMDLEWARSIERECREAGVATFVKQLGGVQDKRAKPAFWPEDLRVRSFPR